MAYARNDRFFGIVRTDAATQGRLVIDAPRRSFKPVNGAPIPGDLVRRYKLKPGDQILDGRFSVCPVRITSIRAVAVAP